MHQPEGCKRQRKLHGIRLDDCNTVRQLGNDCVSPGADSSSKSGGRDAEPQPRAAPAAVAESSIFGILESRVSRPTSQKIRQVNEMKSILDRSFRYVPSMQTDLRKDLRPYRRESQLKQASALTGRGADQAAAASLSVLVVVGPSRSRGYQAPQIPERANTGLIDTSPESCRDRFAQREVAVIARYACGRRRRNSRTFADPRRRTRCPRLAAGRPPGGRQPARSGPCRCCPESASQSRPREQLFRVGGLLALHRSAAAQRAGQDHGEVGEYFIGRDSPGRRDCATAGPSARSSVSVLALAIDFTAMVSMPRGSSLPAVGERSAASARRAAGRLAALRAADWLERDRGIPRLPRRRRVDFLGTRVPKHAEERDEQDGSFHLLIPSLGDFPDAALDVVRDIERAVGTRGGPLARYPAIRGKDLGVPGPGSPRKERPPQGACGSRLAVRRGVEGDECAARYLPGNAAAE